MRNDGMAPGRNPRQAPGTGATVSRRSGLPSFTAAQRIAPRSASAYSLRWRVMIPKASSTESVR